MQHTPPRQLPLWHSSLAVQGWPLSRRWVTSGEGPGGAVGDGDASTIVGVGCVGIEALVPGVADGTGVVSTVGAGVAVPFVGVGCPDGSGVPDAVGVAVACPVGPAVADAVGVPIAVGTGVPVDEGGGVGTAVGVSVGVPGVGDVSSITHT